MGRFSETFITAAGLLARLKTVDGAGTGLDADLLDGYHAADLPVSGPVGDAITSVSVDLGSHNALEAGVHGITEVGRALTTAPTVGEQRLVLGLGSGALFSADNTPNNLPLLGGDGLLATSVLPPDFLPYQWTHFHAAETSIVTAGSAIRNLTDGSQRFSHYADQEPPAQNDSFTFEVTLAAGIYRLDTIGSTQTNMGIATIERKGPGEGGFTALATQDWYAAGAYNVVRSSAGLTFTAGTHTIRVTAATNNVSSSNYYLRLTVFSFRRTGA